MSIKIRPYNKGSAWEVDIRVTHPNGVRERERVKASTPSRSTTQRWAEAREREILLRGPKKERKEVVVPTLKEFAPRFMTGYAHADRLKPSGIAAKQSIIDTHLLPALGDKRLDAIGNEDVQELKSRLKARAPKTVNNVLTVLNTLLRTAVEWHDLEAMPCQIRLLKVPKNERPFHDFEAYERLVAAARAISPETHLVVLLGGEAGLRCGEMMALGWTDIDLKRRPAHLVVERSEWKGQVTSPKGNRGRRIPLTARLASALGAHKHLRCPRVLCNPDGSPLTQKQVQGLVKRAARKAGLSEGGVHTLRHTFCSHLAMRGATAKAIQELAGHTDLATTQQYMHLSPVALEQAIALLEGADSMHGRGEIVETATGKIASDWRAMS